MLSMTPLPMLDSSGASIAPRPAIPDWGTAQGNLEDAKVAVEALRHLVDDAVFLDEEAYSSAANIQGLVLRIQAQQRRMREMEHEITALRAEVESKDMAVAAATARHREAQTQIAELQQELDNNSVVFKMHYQELIVRNQEIEQLKATIEQLTQQQQAQQQPASTTDHIAQ